MTLPIDLRDLIQDAANRRTKEVPTQTVHQQESSATMILYKCGFCASTVEADSAPLCPVCLDRTSGQMKVRMTAKPETVTHGEIHDEIYNRLRGR